MFISLVVFRPFQCDQCEKAYKWKEDLRAHRMVEHLGIYPFKCRYCSKGYSGSSNKNWHEKRCPNNPIRAEMIPVTGMGSSGVSSAIISPPIQVMHATHQLQTSPIMTTMVQYQ